MSATTMTMRTWIPAAIGAMALLQPAWAEPAAEVRVTYSNGQFQMGISGAVGPDYIIQRSINHSNFAPIATNTPASTPFNYIDLSAGTNRAFYRVLLGP